MAESPLRFTRLENTIVDIVVSAGELVSGKSRPAEVVIGRFMTSLSAAPGVRSVCRVLVRSGQGDESAGWGQVGGRGVLRIRIPYSIEAIDVEFAGPDDPEWVGEERISRVRSTLDLVAAASTPSAEQAEELRTRSIVVQLERDRWFIRSSAATRVLGHVPEVARHRAPLSLVDPRDRVAAMRAYVETLGGRRESVTVDLRVSTADGGNRVLEMTYVAVGGSRRSVVVYGVDVTAERTDPVTRMDLPTTHGDTAGQARWVSKVLLAALVCVLMAADLVVIAWSVLSFRHGVSAYVYRLDLDVYRIGVDAWLRGGELYEGLPATRFGTHLPFFYPPIAAVLMAPFALVPFGVASFAMAMLTIAAVALVLVVLLRSLDVRPSMIVTFALLPIALVLDPIRATLTYGQINMLLMVLIVLDCLVGKPRWPRGALVGLAAAVKLAPALFVLFFLLRGDRRAAVTALVSFLCLTGVGFLLAPRDSVRFWTSTVFRIDQMVGITFRSNQSIAAFLARLGIDSVALRIVLAVAVIALTVIGMRRAFAAGQHVWALSLNALCPLLISPLSWAHHWVWVMPILLSAGVAAWRARNRVAIAIVAGATLLVTQSPYLWFDSNAPWTVWRLLIGGTYLFAALAVLMAYPRVITGVGRART